MSKVLRTSLILCLALWSWEAVMVRTAHASCGDWLADPSATMSSHLPTPDAVRDSGTSATRHRKPQPQSPCDGPGCRQAPYAPSAPLPVRIEFRSHDVAAMFLKTMTLGSQGTRTSVSLFDAGPLSGYPTAIERPPCC
ncbi:MAG: hypothetical protein KDA80_13825 [Planctomycetaceae bacterium]|nr:hypothetical protein [Planctomycetaceae bacterium]